MEQRRASSPDEYIREFAVQQEYALKGLSIFLYIPLAEHGWLQNVGVQMFRSGSSYIGYIPWRSLPK